MSRNIYKRVVGFRQCSLVTGGAYAILWTEQNLEMWNFGYEWDFADETFDNNKMNNKIFGRISLTTNETLTNRFSQWCHNMAYSVGSFVFR